MTYYTWRVKKLFSKILDPLYDVRAFIDGYISITSCRVNLVHEETFLKLQKGQVRLQFLLQSRKGKPYLCGKKYLLSWVCWV